MSLLLKHGADPNLSGFLLHLAVLKLPTHAISFLLRSGADPNSVDKDGSTPLFIAIQRNNPKCVSLLLESGAHPNHLNQVM